MISSARLPRLLLAALLLCLGVHGTAQAQFDLDAIRNNTPSYGDSRDSVTLNVTSQRTSVPPDTTFPVAVTFEIKKDWHIWPQEGGSPENVAIFDGAQWTSITKAGGNGLEIIDITWPEIHTAKVDVGLGPQEYAVFEGDATALVTLKVSKNLETGSTATIDLAGFFQACDASTCLAPTFDPPIGTVSITIDPAAPTALKAEGLFAGWKSGQDSGIPGSTGTAAGTDGAAEQPARVSSDSGPSFFGLTIPKSDGTTGIVILILLSMLGGFILNLTPCVLPVIPIKIMTLSQHAATPGRALALGLWMTVGVIAFWLAIGLPVVFFASVTDPSRIFGIWWVTFGVGILIGVMGIGIMGLFTLSLPQSTYLFNPKADTAWGSFLFGVMTAVLGLPCFGFVAGALFAGAATLPPVVTLLIFGSIGVGMGAPYLVLSANPRMVEKIPRTGPASELVKQVMGLLLLAAAAYFVGSGLIVLVAEMPWMGRQLHWWAIAIALILAGSWLVLRTFQITSRSGPRVFWTLIALVLAVVPTIYAIEVTQKARLTWDALASLRGASTTAFSTKVWNPYTPERFQAARDAGKTVVVDFTAEWCINCKALKATVLDDQPVKGRLEDDESIVTFTADNSARSAAGWALMKELGQTGIPLLAIWGPADPENMPWQSTAYTSNQVMSAVEARTAESGES